MEKFKQSLVYAGFIRPSVANVAEALLLTRAAFCDNCHVNKVRSSKVVFLTFALNTSPY